MASQVLQDCLYRPLSDPSPLSCDSGLSGGLGGQSGPPGLSVLAPCLTRPPSPVTADSQAASVASQVLQDCLYRPLSDPSPLSCDSGLSGGLGGQSGPPGLSVSPPV